MTDAELDSLAEQADSTHATHSGCTDYACYCHAKLPVLVAALRRLRAYAARLEGTLLMFGDTVGYATLRDAPLSAATRHPFGSPADIAGQTLRVLERNAGGDCLCLSPAGDAIVDVAAADIVTFRPR